MKKKGILLRLIAGSIVIVFILVFYFAEIEKKRNTVNNSIMPRQDQNGSVQEKHPNFAQSKNHQLQNFVSSERDSSLYDNLTNLGDPIGESSLMNKKSLRDEESRGFSEEDQDQLSLVQEEVFRLQNQKTVLMIYEKMKSDEIDSLKNSIVNDQKILKQIERSGTNIETYQLVEENLEKRKERLKVLMHD